MRKMIWLALVTLCGCVPVIASWYQPVGPGEVKIYNPGCSMTVLGRVIQHLPAHVDVEVNALARTPGIAHPSIAVSIEVPSGTTVRLADSRLTVRAGPLAPAIPIEIDRVQRPRTIVNRQVSDALEPGDLLGGPAGYGISVRMPDEWAEKAPAELIITVPALDINGQRVKVEPMTFVLKKRPHVTGFC